MNQVIITENKLVASRQSLPTHIAIIMDGNGRWAKARGLPRTAGHKKGAEAIRRTLDACEEFGIPYLTVYAFSSENWNRAPDEINDLMQLLQHYLQNELDNLNQRGVRLRFIGDLSMLEKNIQEQLEYAKNLTARNKKFNFTIALSYGSKQEIVRAMRKLAQQVADGSLSPEDIKENLLDKNLDTADLPELDLLIRTGGEKRISNFLLWQSAYTEFYFCDTLWPDFDKNTLQDAITDFSKRERRYGTAN